MPVDPTKIGFANYFGVFSDPATQMMNRELGFNTDMRLVFKDDVDALHLLPSFDDYQNIYNPQTIQITQTVASATVGVGTEGDYSADVVTAMPYAFSIMATEIHERQILIQYDKDGNIKDILPLPNYFCKLGTATDVLNVNSGVMTEAVSKTEIVAHITREELTNNAIFKLMPLETTTIETTSGYPITLEANNDDIASQNSLYMGSDNYLYLVTDIAQGTIGDSFWVFNVRSQPIQVQVPTKYFLFAKDDVFTMVTGRSMADYVQDSDYEFILPAESFTITKILRSRKVTLTRLSSENLTISADLKSVEGLDSESFYDIIVSTDEVKPNPTLQYSILDITEGFMGYLYRVMKFISDNAGGIGEASMGSLLGKKYVFQYTFTAVVTTSSFTIPQEYYNPASGDSLFLSFKGLQLEKDVDYTVDDAGIITFSFTLDVGDVVNSVIFKYATKGGESVIVSALQNRLDTLDSNITNYTLSVEDYKTMIRMGAIV